MCSTLLIRGPHSPRSSCPILHSPPWVFGHLVFVLKVWNGEVFQGAIEGARRTVSLAWGEECDVEVRTPCL